MNPRGTAAAILILSACGGPADGGGAGDATGDGVERPGLELTGRALGLEGGFPADFDPCGLLSNDEAARAAGAGVARAESQTLPGGLATCTFEPDEGLMPPVVLEVRPGDGAFETARAMAVDAEGFEELAGVGERAFYSELLGHNIVLVAGGRYANLIVRRDPAADNRGRAEEAARLVAERLP